VREEPWAFWDFLPTAAELASTKVPAAAKTDGLSLVSFLKGGPAPQRDVFYWELHEGKPIQAVRFGKEMQWKAVKNGLQAPVELYDLSNDPGESKNIAADHPPVVKQAVALMKDAHAENPDWPLTGPAPVRKKAGEKGKKAK
jgi:arylsulfatase A